MNRILGIETSCDETGIAIVEAGRRVLANRVASQADIHAAFGGVVPEIASRRHTEVIGRIAQAALDEAGGTVDAVAATCGPGLMGSLLVGVNFAKSLAMAWGVPFIPVHHLEGHVFSVFLCDDAPEFPFLALIVSGGHTCLVECDGPRAYRMLSTTRDDAVGESFDKVARLLDLPYPGGPSIQKAAEPGDPYAFDFPRGMAKHDTLDFSYSGLKTAVLYLVREGRGTVADIAASFQHAAIDALILKTQAALEQTRAPRLVVAGGVAANRLLRERLARDIAVPVFVPPMAYCVDNGAMIAAAAWPLFEAGQVGHWGAPCIASLPLTEAARLRGAA